MVFFLFLITLAEAKTTCVVHLIHYECEKVCQCRECTNGIKTWGCEEKDFWCSPVHCNKEPEVSYSPYISSDFNYSQNEINWLTY